MNEKEIYNLVMKYLHSANHPDFDDFRQEVRMKIFLAESKFKNHSTYKTYCHRVAINAILGHMRKQKELKFNVSIVDDGTPPTPKSVTLDSIEKKTSSSSLNNLMLIEALAELSPRQRRILQLFHVEGKSHEVIASELGITTPTIKTVLFRSRKSIKEYFNNTLP